MPDTETKPTVLEDLRSKRSKLETVFDETVEAREKDIVTFEAREADEDPTKRPSEEDRTAFLTAEDEFRTARAEFITEREGLNERIDSLSEREQRRLNAETVSVGKNIKITEPLVYRKDNFNEVCFLKDMMMRDEKVRQATILDSRAALERLDRHGKQMAERIAKEDVQYKREAEEQTEQAEREFRGSLAGQGVRQQALENPFERRVNPNRTVGQGGEMIPPKWEIDQFAEYLRAGRVIAPLARNIPLPAGTDVIKVPRVKLGTETGPQTADNAGLVSRDLTTESIEAPIKTIGGYEDVALQAIEQSPNQIFARMVQEDMMAEWNRNIDREVSYGTGTEYTNLAGGTIKGLWPASNWGGEAHESGSAISGQTILQGLGCNWSWIATKRFNTQNVHHVIHPKRAAYLMHAFDITSETGRLLINASDFPNLNLAGEMGSDTPAEGLVFRLPNGANVHASANLQSVNKAATGKEATGYDYGLTAKWDDVWFYESDARMDVFSEILSGTLQVRFRIYSYVGMLVRFEPSVQVCGGKPFEKAPTLGGFVYGA